MQQFLKTLMNKSGYLLAGVCLVASSVLSADEFETDVQLDTKSLVSAELLKGENHSVSEQTKVINYALVFTLQQGDSSQLIKGRENLQIRINEINAIASLNEVSQTEAFISSLTDAAKKPVSQAVNIVTNPVETVTELPNSVGRYLSGSFFKITRTIGKVSEEAVDLVSSSDEKDSGESDGLSMDKASDKAEELGKDQLGYSDAKRQLAKKLSVDPYSDNQELQTALERVAWATAAGSFAGNVAIPDSDVLKVSGDLQDLVWETSETELIMQNHDRLESLGFEEQTVEQFHDHKQYILSEKVAFSLAMEKLKGVDGLPLLMDLMLASENRDESRMVVKISSALADGHQSKATLKMLQVKKGLLAGVTIDNKLAIPVAVDYLIWTEQVDTLSSAKEFDYADKSLWLKGDISTTARKNLEQKGWTIVSSKTG